MNRSHDQKIYFTVGFSADSMVTVPPIGTAIGAISNLNTIGLSVVRPSGIKLCPPNIPMSLRIHPIIGGRAGPRQCRVNRRRG